MRWFLYFSPFFMKKKKHLQEKLGIEITKDPTEIFELLEIIGTG
jgi:hypothetical protein